MNIVDTRANNTLSFLKRKNIENIPLFELSFLDHALDLSTYTDIIFQSTPSVEFFKYHDDIQDKKVFAMGLGTQSALKSKGVFSNISRKPGSDGLKNIIENRIESGKFLIVKGEGGLNIISDHLEERGAVVETLENYQRFKFSSYSNLINCFKNADFVIFPSKLSAEIYFQEIYNTSMNSKFISISRRIKDYVDSLGYENFQLDYFADNFESEILKIT